MVHRLIVSARAAETRLLASLLEGQSIANLGRIVAEGGQLYLQLGLACGGASGEDLQDEVEAVENLRGKFALDVEYLAGAESIVKYQLLRLWLMASAIFPLPI